MKWLISGRRSITNVNKRFAKECIEGICVSTFDEDNINKTSEKNFSSIQSVFNHESRAPYSHGSI